MSKELDALIDLYTKLSCRSNILELKENFKEFEIVEKALKKVDKLEEENKTVHEYNVQLCLVRDKLNKALEIMKNGLNLEHVLLVERTTNYEEYDAQFDSCLERRYEPFKFEIRKSREEYNLLKEVLNG